MVYREPHFAGTQNVKYFDTKELYVGAAFMGSGR